MSTRYTLAELADASAAALDALEVAAPNGQVRQRPDVRTLRYYGTLGLLSRPVEMAGRTAVYGERHLLQVLAVKALQARGASLADVQRSLAGASDQELHRAIGHGLPQALTAAAAPKAGPPDRAFWRMLPQPPASPAGDLRPRHLIAVPLAPGATLLIEGDPGGLVNADAVRAAAAPLLTHLTGAGLLPGAADPAGADA